MQKDLSTAQLAKFWKVDAKRISERAKTRGIKPTRMEGRTAFWPLLARRFLGPVPVGLPGQEATKSLREAWKSRDRSRKAR